ncbi:MAG: hypothetical protein MZV64_14630 [Ignavibacteriales bacterium]|nr:hypothetical protein [Ignavibacteriales bacterium]
MGPPGSGPGPGRPSPWGWRRSGWNPVDPAEPRVVREQPLADPRQRLGEDPGAGDPRDRGDGDGPRQHGGEPPGSGRDPPPEDHRGTPPSPPPATSNSGWSQDGKPKANGRPWAATAGTETSAASARRPRRARAPRLPRSAGRGRASATASRMGRTSAT